MKLRVALLAVILISSASTARAGLGYDPALAGFQPRVPISQLGAVTSWFDPSRLHLASTFTVGSGFSGQTSALQTTSLSYQFHAPLAMNVRVGNAFGPDAARSGSSFFLQGLDVAWRPSVNTVFQIQFEDRRSPLQYGYPYGGSYRGW